MLIKLDIKKAYDKVDWYFLCKCLDAFGFNKQWINLVFKCIATPRISILVNGASEGFFKISRGLRQGDPLSPFLFIIMVESLGRLINRAREKALLVGIKITSNMEPITHQQFVDDTMLFGSSSHMEAYGIKNILNNYTNISDQEINTIKSNITFFNTNKELQTSILKILKFNEGEPPCKYLGLPLDKGTRSSSLWNQVVSKITNIISSWKGKWLSSTGKATLIKAVLSAMAIYQLSCMDLPASKRKEITSHIRTFFWQGLEDKARLPLIAWDKICLPKEMGGLGIKDLLIQSKALGAKLVWRMFSNPNAKWARTLFNKYLHNPDPISIFRTAHPPKGS